MPEKIEKARVPLWSFGEGFKEESTKPRADCEEPNRWTMMDEVAPEVEVLKFLQVLVKLLKPDHVLTYGDVTGYASLYIAQGLRENGFGKVSVLGLDDSCVQAAASTCFKSGHDRWISFVQHEDVLARGATVGFFDPRAESDAATRLRFIEKMAPGSLLLMHDGLKTSPNPLEKPTVYLPTPRGLSISQV